MACLSVIRPGMLTTVQDLGRWGHQNLGVPVAGPMDWYSHTLANRLVGNHDTAAALEVTLIGPELEADRPVFCAIAGARFEVFVNGTPVALDRPFEIRGGGRLRFGNRLAGARAVMAVAGGIVLPETFGSRATSLVSRMGPFEGRQLHAGDVLPIGDDGGVAAHDGGVSLSMPLGGARVRVVMGPHDDWFTPEARQAFLSSRYSVSPQSNRMGYRLEGPPLMHVASADLLSDATPVGSVQVPASGKPILLMADRQTTGGYPKIATVISADLPRAGQLAPGDWIEFAPVSRAAAVDALRALTARLGSRRA